MDYEEFNREYKKFDEWWKEQPKYEDREKLEKENVTKFRRVSNVLKLPQDFDALDTNNDDWLDFRAYNCTDRLADDRVNSPSHYTRGSQEVIVTIEEAIQDAPTVKDGMLQAQVLKYILRLWLKDNPAEDARKAEWYLKRLIDSLNS